MGAARLRGAAMMSGGQLEARAHALLEANTRHAERDGTPYRYTVPSPGSYPFQWFWDSCFHAIAWTHFDVERAADELRSLLAWQRPDGFIPHVIFWDRRRAMRQTWHYLESAGWLRVPWLPLARGKPATSALMQPPVLAVAAERVFAAGAGTGFLRDVVPAVLRYHRWLLETRDPDGDGLISIIAPSESGMDYSPVFDAALGLGRDPGPLRLAAAMRLVTLRNKLAGWTPQRLAEGRAVFDVEDVLVNSCLVADLEASARLARAAGDGSGAEWAAAQSARSLAALIERCYDARAGAFHNLDGPPETVAPGLTIGALLPLTLHALPREIAGALVTRQLTRADAFWPRYPAPSVALSEPEFRADSRPGGAERIWRGGTWINTNWLLARGLRHHGFDAEADAIRDASVSLVGRHGFREYFNPLTGAPGGASQFGWSTLAIDIE